VNEDEMIWPEKPTCHGDHAPFAPDVTTWQVRSDGLRHCNYCGSLHPEDLVALVAKGATIHGSDWKYGWPHKFYIEGTGQPGAMKWYNDHVGDEGYSPAALAALTTTLARSGIHFAVVEVDGRRRVRYSAPYPGYQQ
jgi:hypothetical protein